MKYQHSVFNVNPLSWKCARDTHTHMCVLHTQTYILSSSVWTVALIGNICRVGEKWKVTGEDSRTESERWHVVTCIVCGRADGIDSLPSHISLVFHILRCDWLHLMQNASLSYYALVSLTFYNDNWFFKYRMGAGGSEPSISLWVWKLLIPIFPFYYFEDWTRLKLR